MDAEVQRAIDAAHKRIDALETAWHLKETAQDNALFVLEKDKAIRDIALTTLRWTLTLALTIGAGIIVAVLNR